MLDVMMPELAEAVKDFYNLTGIKTVLYDADRKFLYSYPMNMCGFCDKIRKCKSLIEKCFEFCCENTLWDFLYQTKESFYAEELIKLNKDLFATAAEKLNAAASRLREYEQYK